MTERRRLRWLALLAAFALLVAACGGGRDDGDEGATGGGGEEGGQVEPSPGITDTEIKLGGSYPFSGPASAYGTIGKSVAAYFKYINSQGGVKMGDGKTRKINFVALDDGYAPPRAVENAKKLIEQEKVFALFNTLGTPNNLAIWDYTNQQEVPQVFVATGASHWGRDPSKHPWTTGWQPAYPTEAAIFAEYLKENMPNAKVAVLQQNDDFGEDTLHGFEEAIQGSSVKIVQKETYEVTDPTVDSQVTNLSKSGADVFYNITTPKFAAQAIKKIGEIGWKPLHLLHSVSASREAVLKPAGLQNAQGIITATYLKDPSDPQWANDAAIKEYMELAKQHGGDFNVLDPFGVYGFAVGETLVKALEATKEPTREAFMEAVRSMQDVEIPLLIPGIKINMDGEDDTFPIEAMQLSKFEGETYHLQGEVIDYEGKTPVPAE